MRAPEGTSLVETRLIAERSRRRSAHARRGAHAGHHRQRPAGTQQPGEHLRALVDPSERKDDQYVIDERASGTRSSRRCRRTCASTCRRRRSIAGGGSQAAVQYTITGPDLRSSPRYDADVLHQAAQGPRRGGRRLLPIVGNPEVKVSSTASAPPSLGVDVIDVADALRAPRRRPDRCRPSRTNGERLRGARPRRARSTAPTRTALRLMTVPTKPATTVPLSSVVRLNERHRSVADQPLARQRQVTITANVGAGRRREHACRDQLAQIIDDLHLPPAYSAVPAGATKEAGKAARASSSPSPSRSSSCTWSSRRSSSRGCTR